MLDKAEVEFFIEFMEKNDVNLDVLDFNKNSLLIKAQAIPGCKNPHTKKFSKAELEDKAVVAVEYLLKRGADINYQNKKNGITALLSASHWGYSKVAAVLLKYGANPDLGSDSLGFVTNPLLSATYKNKKEIVHLLISHGADPLITKKYSAITTGFKLSEEQEEELNRAHLIYKFIYVRRMEAHLGRKTVLSQTSDLVFDELLNLI